MHSNCRYYFRSVLVLAVMHIIWVECLDPLKSGIRDEIYTNLNLFLFL